MPRSENFRPLRKVYRQAWGASYSTSALGSSFQCIEFFPPRASRRQENPQTEIRRKAILKRPRPPRMRTAPEMGTTGNVMPQAQNNRRCPGDRKPLECRIANQGNLRALLELDDQFRRACQLQLCRMVTDHSLVYGISAAAILLVCRVSRHAPQIRFFGATRGMAR